MTIVAALGVGVLAWAGRAPTNDEASDVDSAVVIDLPPAEASSQQVSNAAEGPEQQATQASASRLALQQIKPPKEQSKPVEEPKLEPVTKPVQEPLPPVMPDPSAVLERKQDEVSPPEPVAAPATPAQDEHAPAGAETPAKSEVVQGEERRSPASAHAITLWQKSLMQRLEMAKRMVGREVHPAGTVKVAFVIDGKGALASERVVQSSGSPSLDKAALLLVRTAAPFPAPPLGSGDRDTSFVVPIRFR